MSESTLRAAVAAERSIYNELLLTVLRSQTCIATIATLRWPGKTVLNLGADAPDIVALQITGRTDAGLAYAEKAAAVCRTIVLLDNFGPYTAVRLSHSPLACIIDLNTAVFRTLQDAVSQVCLGRTYFSPTYSKMLAHERANPKAPHKLLSQREVVVLGLIGQGFSDHEIGCTLQISDRTAQTHRSNIMCKLMVASSAKLVAYAVSAGYFPTDAPLPPPLRNAILSDETLR